MSGLTTQRKNPKDIIGIFNSHHFLRFRQRVVFFSHLAFFLKLIIFITELIVSFLLSLCML